MITLSHFSFALVIFVALVIGIGGFIGLLEILGREALAKPEPETLCLDCHLLFKRNGERNGEYRAVAQGRCLRCEDKEILSAAKDVGKRERRNQPEDRRFMEGL